jgi:hypothetical protein
MAKELEKIQRLYKTLLEVENYKFPNSGKKLEAPTDQGVYVIYDPNDKVLHVGKTSKAKKGLRQRLQNHLQGQSSFTQKHLRGSGKKLRGKYTFKYVKVDDPRLRTLLEAYALSHLCPIHLGVGISVRDRRK